MRNRKVKTLLICFVLVLFSSSFSNAQVRPPGPPVDDLVSPPDGPQSKPVARPVQKQPTIDEWMNGKHSLDVYKVKSSDDDETRLKKQRINMALMEIRHFKRLYEQGVTNAEVASASIETQNRLLKAQLEFHTKPDEIILALEQSLKSAKLCEAVVRNQIEAGMVSTQQLGEATFNRLDIEIQLLRAKKTLQRK